MFQKFISADEAKISEKLKGKGDVKAVQKNDALLRELNDLENGLSTGTTERNSKRSAFSMKDLRDELNEDFEQAIKQNLESFEGKFVLYQKQLKQELSKFIRDENDRLLVAVKEGPHDRIKNEVCSPASEQSPKYSSALTVIARDLEGDGKSVRAP